MIHVEIVKMEGNKLFWGNRRGLSPIPLSFTHTPDGKLLKIVKSEICERESENAECGRVISLEGGKIQVTCKKGSLNILTVLPEGKGRMSEIGRAHV